MENKESGATRPVGMCEKLFNALHLNPTFRPLRRIAYHSQETAAAAKPASLPQALSAVGDGPAPPTSKPSGSEYSNGAAAAAARQVSAKKVPEPKLSKVESVNVMIPLKVPSKVDAPAAAAVAGATTISSQKLSYVEPAVAAAAAAGATAIPSKKLSYTVTEPQPPPPSRLPTERVPSSYSKPTTPTPPPEKVVSKTDGTRASVDSTQSAPATEEVVRTRTRRNLNDRVDEYINRTKNKLRTASNAGSPSSTSK